MEARSVWFKDVTVIDGTGAEPRSGCCVLISGEQILDIKGRLPEDVGSEEVIDASGLVMTPGLIDAHVHFGVSSDIEKMHTSHHLSVAELAADMFANCAQTLRSGFTTVRDTGGIDAGLAQVVASGKVPGPHILLAGPILAQTGGHGYLGAAWDSAEDWHSHDVPGLIAVALLSDGPEVVRRNAREAFRRGADFLKMCVTGGVVSHHDSLSDTQFTGAEIAAAVEEATARGTYVTVHAHNNVGLRTAIDAGARCVEHGTEIDEEMAALMAERGVAHVPTLSVIRALEENVAQAGLPGHIAERLGASFEGQVNAIRASRAAGVLIGSGSDYVGPLQDHRGRELVLRSEVENPMLALISATRDNARVLRIDDEVGTIEPGKRADLTFFSSNPLEDPSVFDDPNRIPLVIKDGRIVKDER